MGKAKNRTYKRKVRSNVLKRTRKSTRRKSTRRKSTRRKSTRKPLRKSTRKSRRRSTRRRNKKLRGGMDRVKALGNALGFPGGGGASTSSMALDVTITVLYNWVDPTTKEQGLWEIFKDGEQKEFKSTDTIRTIKERIEDVVLHYRNRHFTTLPAMAQILQRDDQYRRGLVGPDSEYLNDDTTIQNSGIVNGDTLYLKVAATAAAAKATASGGIKVKDKPPSTKGQKKAGGGAAPSGSPSGGSKGKPNKRVKQDG